MSWMMMPPRGFKDGDYESDRDAEEYHAYRKSTENTVRFEDVYCGAETDKAIFCDIGGLDVWIPKSQIHDDSEVWKKGQEGALIVTRWIAEKKSLV